VDAVGSHQQIAVRTHAVREGGRDPIALIDHLDQTMADRASVGNEQPRDPTPVADTVRELQIWST
jgi:hypothetical protein